MHSLVRFLLMVFLSMGVWMAIGLGVGLLLHRLVPAIDLGMATLIAVVTLGGCFLWLSRISTLEALYGHDDSERSDATWIDNAPPGGMELNASQAATETVVTLTA